MRVRVVYAPGLDEFVNRGAPVDLRAEPAMLQSLLEHMQAAADPGLRPTLPGLDAVVDVDAPPADVTVHLLLTGNDESNPGTHRARELFELWAAERGVGLEVTLLNAGARALDDLMKEIEVLIDRLAATPAEQLRVAIGPGTRQMNMALMASVLQGLDLPRNVEVVEVLDDHRTEVRVAPRRVAHVMSASLVREHIRQRIDRWEIFDARVLADEHPSVVAREEAELITAAATYLQRDVEPLMSLLDVELEAGPGELALLQCLDTVEHLLAVQRHEEQVIILLGMLLRDLVPLAWAERFVCDHLGREVVGTSVLDAIVPAGRAAAVRRERDELTGAVPFRLSSQAAELLAHRGCRALVTGDRVTYREADALDGVLPRDPRAYMLWITLNRALTPARNLVVHRWKDLDANSLRTVLQEASAKLPSLLGGEFGAALDAAAGPPDDEQRRVLDAVEAEDFEPGAQLRSRTNSNKRLVRDVADRLAAGQRVADDEVEQVLDVALAWAGSWRTNLDALLWSLTVLRRAGADALAERLADDLRRRIGVVDERLHAATRAELRAVADELCIPLSVPHTLVPCGPHDQRPGPFRQLLATFSPLVVERESLVALARRRLLDSLS